MVFGVKLPTNCIHTENHSDFLLNYMHEQLSAERNTFYARKDVWINMDIKTKVYV